MNNRGNRYFRQYFCLYIKGVRDVKKQIVYIVSVIASVTLLVFSVSHLGTVSELMLPPETSGEYSEIIKAIEKKTGENIVLKTPQSLRGGSSVNIDDFNSDGTEDALVFYSVKGSSKVYIAFLTHGDRWMCSEPIEGEGSGVVKFDCEDMDLDGKKELTVGWSVPDIKDTNSLSVYSLHKRDYEYQIEKLTSLPFTDYIAADVTGRGKCELFVISNRYITAPKEAVKGTLYELAENNLSEICTSALNEKARGYSAIRCDSIQDSHIIYIDSIISQKQNKIFTQALIYKSGKLVNLGYSSGKDLSSVSERNGVLKSEDIDEDGLTEIPIPVESYESGTQNLISWVSYTSRGFETVKQSYADFSNRFSFSFPEKWKGNVTVIKDSNQSSYGFYDIRRGKKLLFEIKVYSISDDITDIKDGYKQLFIDNGFAYGLKKTDKTNTLNISEDEIISCIKN